MRSEYRKSTIRFHNHWIEALNLLRRGAKKKSIERVRLIGSAHVLIFWGKERYGEVIVSCEGIYFSLRPR